MKLQMFDISRFQLEISFIAHKLSEMISQGSSGLVVKDASVRYGGPWFKLQQFFFDILCTLFFTLQ